MSLKHDKDDDLEVQAVRLEAERDFGHERRAQNDIEVLLNIAKLALLSGDIFAWALVSHQLTKASAQSHTSMMKAGDVASKAKGATFVVPNAANVNKAPIAFRKSSPQPINKIDFGKKQKISFKPLPMADTERRGRSKKSVQSNRQRRNFRENLRPELNPQTNLSENPMVNNAQFALQKKKEEQGLTPSYFAPKPQHPQGGMHL